MTLIQFSRNLIRRFAFPGIMAAIAFAAIAWLLVALPARAMPTTSEARLAQMRLSNKERLDVRVAERHLQNEFRQTLIQIIAPAAGLGAAALAWRQYSHQKEVARREASEKLDDYGLDLFSEALKSIAAPQPEVRIGGIYALARLSEVSPSYRASVAEVLSGYVRSNSPWPLTKRSRRPKLRSSMQSQTPNLRTFAPDIQTALELLARHTHTWHDVPNLRFRNSDLRRASLEGCHFENAAFTESSLEGAWLRNAHLDGTSLRGARLQFANLKGASLKGANVRATNFTGADLTDVELEGAIFDAKTRWPKHMNRQQALALGAEEVPANDPPTERRTVAVAPI